MGTSFETHNPNKKQILVLGYYGDFNCGDEIMLKSLLSTLNPQAEVSVMFVKSARYNFDQFKNIFQYYPPKSKNLLAKIAIFYDELIIGGGAHIDDTEYQALDFIPYLGISLSEEMLKLKKEVRWLAVSSNNILKSKNYIHKLRYIVENCQEFSVRDTYSYQVLVNSGINKNKIKLVDDLALSMKKKKTLAVTLIDYSNDDEKLITFIKEIIEFIKNQTDYQICFLPFFNGSYHDINMFERLIKKCDFSGVSYFIAPEYRTVEAMILMIQACDLFVNMRYHASLLALQYHKKLISICYDTHPHYYNKMHYIHEKFNNKNILSYKNYKKLDLFNKLKEITTNLDH